MSPDKPAEIHRDHVVLGMLAAMGAFFMFTVMMVCAKLLSANHSVIEIAFYRNAVATLPFLFMVFALGRREILVIQRKPVPVILRAIFGTISLTVTFYAYSLMPMADTNALMFTSSLFIPILGVLFLKESVGPYRWAAVAIGFVGVLIMVRPNGDVYLLGVTVALGAAMLHAGMQITLRFLGGHERPETVTFYFLFIGTLITALPLPFVFVKPTLAEIPLLVGAGLSGAVAQWLLTVAFKYAPAAVVTVFNYSGIVWSMLFGWLIWNDWPLPSVLAGAAVVIASNLLIIWRESRVGRLIGRTSSSIS